MIRAFRNVKLLGFAGYFLATAVCWTQADTLKVRIFSVAYAGERGAPKASFFAADTPSTSSPLVILIPGGFWQSENKRYTVPEATIAFFRNNGVAVAVVPYRSAKQNGMKQALHEVSEAVAKLLSNSDRSPYDRRRVYLLGHSSGAHLALLIASDASYLRRLGQDPRQLAGVIGLSGIYDLNHAGVTAQADLYRNLLGDDAAVRRQFSPLSHTFPATLPLLILSPEHELPNLPVEARRLIQSTRKVGNKNAHHFFVRDRDHLSLLRLHESNNLGRYHVLHFITRKALPRLWVDQFDAQRFWHDPPYSTEAFWQHPKLIDPYPVDREFLTALFTIADVYPYRYSAWPLKEYHAIDLYSWLKTSGQNPEGKNKHLITTNIRGERTYWHLDEIRQYDPVLVVGLDDERNLFRLTIFYQLLKQYSWKQEGARPPLMSRPVGAFLHFRKALPDHLRYRYLGQYSLTVSSFQVVPYDPLAVLKDLPPSLYQVMTVKNGCVGCHDFRSIRARAHHITAKEGKTHGGHALPLISYDPGVWRNFIFHQEKVAKQMGVSPNMLESAEDTAELFELVSKERKR